MRAKRSVKFGNSSRRAAKLKHNKKSLPQSPKRIETWAPSVSSEPKEMAGYLPGLYLG